MARGSRVVAELGRPETADETAARKAESSRIYRSSQTFRNLIAALLATLAVVAVIIFAVPRGQLAEAPPIDVAETAAGFSEVYGRTVISPDVPEDWRVNSAKIDGDDIGAFTIVYVPDSTSYVNIAQGFEPDPAWVSRMLSGASPSGSVTIDGIAWDRYEISDPSRAGNISYALATDAGVDQVLIFGTADADTAASLASAVTDQIMQLREENP
ncbi:DUF4245 family protein [Microbacterium sp. NPDC089189]|uniref:DUF4245 family protein n=1 Tax=Microbacterium sp. NPDC089189 TaxID=3154972 RepID=UPI0034254183